MVPPRARYRTRWANWFIRAWLCRIRFLNIRCQIKSRSSSAQVGDTYESGQVSSRVEANQFFILKQLQLLFVRQITTLTETTQHNCRELDSSSPFSWQIEFAQPVSLANLVRLPVLSKYQRANSFPSLPNRTEPNRIKLNQDEAIFSRQSNEFELTTKIDEKIIRDSLLIAHTWIMSLNYVELFNIILIPIRQMRSSQELLNLLQLTHSAKQLLWKPYSSSALLIFIWSSNFHPSCSL